ncbi:hypothetical protein BT63DRAFT_421838 [Microthyrium microscopicum]|uniref:Large ribosomal subunit protein bL32m n=1 Tax=Microthyrium microscopicum TaxID=703497 RepID=A0A6A6UPK9_9PEZI|nr:hypothetical protein BT63DRAFT_421838 [Microthyrium microscopicum]
MAFQPAIPSLNLAIPAFLPKLPTSWRIALPLFGMSALPIPVGQLPRPSSILQDIWDGILRAVPKKKTSKSRSRSRQFAGKALKDVMFIVKCPSCGRPKRAVYLCPYCVNAVRTYWKSSWNKVLRGESITYSKSKDLEQHKHEDIEALEAELRQLDAGKSETEIPMEKDAPSLYNQQELAESKTKAAESIEGGRKTDEIRA